MARLSLRRAQPVARAPLDPAMSSSGRMHAPRLVPKDNPGSGSTHSGPQPPDRALPRATRSAQEQAGICNSSCSQMQSVYEEMVAVQCLQRQCSRDLLFTRFQAREEGERAYPFDTGEVGAGPGVGPVGFMQVLRRYTQVRELYHRRPPRTTWHSSTSRTSYR